MRVKAIWFLVVLLVLVILSATPLGPAMGRFALALINVVGAVFGLLVRIVAALLSNV